MEDAYVKIEYLDLCTKVKFFNTRGNSLPQSLLIQLQDALLSLYTHSCKIVVLESEGGKVFCAGASFDELLSLKDYDAAEFFFQGFAQLIKIMVEAPFIILASVEGKVVGGGVGIVAACDYVIASENVAFKLSEFKVGIGPFAIGPILKHKLSITNLTSVAFNPNKWFGVGDSEVSALVNQKVSNEIGNVVMEKVAELALYNTQSLLVFKKMIWGDVDSVLKEAFDYAKISAQLVLSPLTQQFLMSFKK